MAEHEGQELAPDISQEDLQTERDSAVREAERIFAETKKNHSFFDRLTNQLDASPIQDRTAIEQIDQVKQYLESPLMPLPAIKVTLTQNNGTEDQSLLDDWSAQIPKNPSIKAKFFPSHLDTLRKRHRQTAALVLQELETTTPSNAEIPKLIEPLNRIGFATYDKSRQHGSEDHAVSIHREIKTPRGIIELEIIRSFKDGAISFDAVEKIDGKENLRVTLNDLSKTPIPSVNVQPFLSLGIKTPDQKQLIKHDPRFPKAAVYAFSSITKQIFSGEYSTTHKPLLPSNPKQ